MIIKFFKYIFDTTELGFYYICLILSKGFFFYFYLLASILYKIFPISIFKKLKVYFKDKQEDTLAILLLILLFLAVVCVYTYFYPESNIKKVDDGVLNGEKKNNKNDSNETNLYKKYGNIDINNVDFKELKEVNKDVVAWIMVDGTSVNYPIVKTDNNSYYLDHDIKGNFKSSGWVFMDYRNNSDLSDDNTIVYGHNLPNQTAFGSLNNLFSDEWFEKSNHYIVVLTEKGKYVYEVFSIYEINPETYYLQNNFYKKEYKEFINTIENRSIYDFNVYVETTDQIITLSTCTEDNKNRKVVHAKKIK